jgi:hypothetical protein
MKTTHGAGIINHKEDMVVTVEFGVKLSKVKIEI